AAPGWYAVAADIDHDGQHLQDVHILAVGPAGSRPLLRAHSETTHLTLAPGAQGRIAVQVNHLLRTPLHGYVQLITPHHIWPLTDSPIRAFTIAPDSTTRVEFPVTVPVTTSPGQFWAQPKVCAFGHIAYAEPIRIDISDCGPFV